MSPLLIGIVWSIDTDKSLLYLNTKCIYFDDGTARHYIAPQEECSCGIYAVNNLQRAIDWRQGKYHLCRHPVVDNLIFLVRASGKTIFGDWGRRTAHCEVVAAISMGEEMMKSLALKKPRVEIPIARIRL